MPATNTITAFYDFVPLTRIRSSEVDNNFSVFRGHIIPVHPTLAASTAGAYDLGASDYYWRATHAQYSYYYQNAAVAVNPPAGFSAVYFKSDGKAYKRNSAGVENELGGGALGITGTRAAPSTITVAGLTFVTSTGARQLWFITGDTTAGTDITTNPQITIGQDVGQELILVGRDDTRPVIFQDGNGLSLNGDFTAYANTVLGLFWDGTTWTEIFRRD